MNEWGSATSHVAQLTVTIPANPGRFTNLSYSPAMGFSFVFRDGTVGQPVPNPDLVVAGGRNWVDWLNFNYNAPMPLTDMSAVEFTNRFYRAVSP